MVDGAAATGTDRIELYTESYAQKYALGDKKGVDTFIEAAKMAKNVGLGINAGHDLSLDNIKFFKERLWKVVRLR